MSSDPPSDGELPEYLQAIVSEALENHRQNELNAVQVAGDVATDHPHLTAVDHGDRDNLQVLIDLRDAGYLCTDELNAYRRYMLSDDRDEATIEAIVVRSLEELLHDSLEE